MTMIPHDEAVQEIAQCLSRRRESGRRSTAIALGNGIHVQAFNEGDAEQKDPWALAMAVVFNEFDQLQRAHLGRIPVGHQVLYDELRAMHSEDWLSQLSAEILPSRHAPGDSIPYELIRKGGFETVLDFSVCGTLQHALGAARPLTDDAQATTVLDNGYTRVETPSGPTNVWQVYGAVETPKSVRLGLHEQASAIAMLEWLRIQLMRSWPPEGGPLIPPAAYLEQEPHWSLGWFRDMMLRPLLIVGARIDLSDWSTWWLLHQRARLFSVFAPAQRPTTTVLSSRTEPHRHLDHGPAGVNLIEFADFGSLWSALDTAITVADHEIPQV